MWVAGNTASFENRLCVGLVGLRASKLTEEVLLVVRRNRGSFSGSVDWKAIVGDFIAIACSVRLLHISICSYFFTRRARGAPGIRCDRNQVCIPSGGLFVAFGLPVYRAAQQTNR